MSDVHKAIIHDKRLEGEKLRVLKLIATLGNLPNVNKRLSIIYFYSSHRLSCLFSETKTTDYLSQQDKNQG